MNRRIHTNTYTISRKHRRLYISRHSSPRNSRSRNIDSRQTFFFPGEDLPAHWLNETEFSRTLGKNETATPDCYTCRVRETSKKKKKRELESPTRYERVSHHSFLLFFCSIFSPLFIFYSCRLSRLAASTLYFLLLLSLCRASMHLYKRRNDICPHARQCNLV